MDKNYALVIAREINPEDKSCSHLELWKQLNDDDLAELLVRAEDSLNLARNYVKFVKQNPEYSPPRGDLLVLVSAQEKYSNTWSKQVGDQEKMDFATEVTRLMFPQLSR